MLSRTTSLCIGAAGLAFVGYCVYFDRKRRSDPMYKEKIRQRRKQQRLGGSSSGTGSQPLPDLSDSQGIQAYFLQEIQAGEDKLALGMIDAGVEHLVNAVSISGQPHQLLQVLQQTLPPNIFQLLVTKLPGAAAVTKIAMMSEYTSNVFSYSTRRSGQNSSRMRRGTNTSSDDWPDFSEVVERLGELSPDYNMPTARVRCKNNEVLFPEENSDTCDDFDGIVHDIERLKYFTYKRNSETDSLDSLLTRPIVHRPLFPGLAEHLRKWELTKQLTQTKERKIKNTAPTLGTLEFKDPPNLKFKDFGRKKPMQFAPIKRRRFHQSDAGLYDKLGHTLAFGLGRQLFSSENHTPSIAEGLPLKIDTTPDPRFVIAETATLQQSVYTGTTAYAETGDFSSVDIAKPEKGHHSIDMGGKLDPHDLNDGIIGSRFFKKCDVDLRKAKQKGSRSDDVRRRSAVRRSVVESNDVKQCEEGFRKSVLISDKRRKRSSGRHRSSGLRKHSADLKTLRDIRRLSVNRPDSHKGRRKSSAHRRHRKSSILDEPYLSLLREVENRAAKRTGNLLSVF